MRAVLTVIGKDKVGIIATVSHHLAEAQVNILDVSQTILADNFTMMMLLNIEHSVLEFQELQKQLQELGQELGVQIHIQREEIFETMHKL